MEQQFLGVEPPLDANLYQSHNSVNQQQQQQQQQLPQHTQMQGQRVQQLQQYSQQQSPQTQYQQQFHHNLIPQQPRALNGPPSNQAFASSVLSTPKINNQYDLNNSNIVTNQPQYDPRYNQQFQMSYQFHSHHMNSQYNSPSLNHLSQQNQSQNSNQLQSHSLGYDDLHQQGRGDKDLVPPIPPLHIQQQLVNSSEIKSEDVSNVGRDSIASTMSNPTTALSTSFNGSTSISNTSTSLPTGQGDQMLRSSCSRCKKEFDQHIIIPQQRLGSGNKFLAEPKIFKLCHHCRELQRQRSRRWQKKTKDKQGVCRRCGSEIPPEEQKFVLCPSCRQNLRTRKANRAAQGKCVHCSGPLDASIITDQKVDENSTTSSTTTTTTTTTTNNSSKTSKANYKVCQRCRENDKIRRTNLEKLEKCNRCAKTLDEFDRGKHKVCSNCRNKKRRLHQSQSQSNINTGITNTDLKYNSTTDSNPSQDVTNSMMAAVAAGIAPHPSHFPIHGHPVPGPIPIPGSHQMSMIPPDQQSMGMMTGPNDGSVPYGGPLNQYAPSISQQQYNQLPFAPQYNQPLMQLPPQQPPQQQQQQIPRQQQYMIKDDYQNNYIPHQ
ncbi:hypothetical protein DFJ63DRAFT_338063 [Scheffersomyces coipomensis]|uniref:uncharacterized protein n=1 Tax=Scheffersomyces coipomensis TaxID=1788519 RepID=UPI00315D7E28